MDRSEGINVAVGALLVGIGVVILGLLAPEAATVVAAACTVAGLYLIVGGAYFGLPSLRTATDRAFSPKLEGAKAEIDRVEGNNAIVRIEVANTGRDDLNGAVVIVSVPSFVSRLDRCNYQGEVGLPQHKGEFYKDNEASFWNGNVSFPGRLPRVVFFRVTLSTLRAFEVEFKVSSPGLHDAVVSTFQLTPPVESLAPVQAPETGGPAS
jgi:hypothetical protein